MRLFGSLFGALLLLAAPAQAQELLVNRSFETPVVPLDGNNFYASISGWTVYDVTPASPLPFNVIRPTAAYANNPSAPPTGGGVQYFDVNAASGVLRQDVVVPAAGGMVDIGGWFSVRDTQQALTGLTVNLRRLDGTLVTSISTSFLSSDPIGLWKQVAASNIPVSGGTYRFEVVIPNPANFDLATMVFKPALTLGKTHSAQSDPVNGTSNPKLVPGGLAEYAIVATAPSAYAVTANSLAVIDPTPANSDLVVANIGGAGSGPAGFTPGASGLTYNFASLGSTTDNLDFSNDGAMTWTYIPVANADGADPAVTHVRVRPQGTMAAGSSFTVRLRYRIE